MWAGRSKLECQGSGYGARSSWRKGPGKHCRGSHAWRLGRRACFPGEMPLPFPPKQRLLLSLKLAHFTGELAQARGPDTWSKLALAVSRGCFRMRLLQHRSGLIQSTAGLGRASTEDRRHLPASVSDFSASWLHPVFAAKGQPELAASPQSLALSAGRFWTHEGSFCKSQFFP